MFIFIMIPIIKNDYYMNGSIARVQYLLQDPNNFENDLCFYSNDIYHNTDGAAYIEYHINGYKRIEKYYIDGKLHREKEPAIIEYDLDENVTKKSYYKNGIFFNEEYKPTYIEFYSNGNVKYEEYYSLNARNSYTMYKSINYYISGNISKIMIFEYGSLHNEEKPSIINYFDCKDKVQSYVYFKFGKRNRDDGPAYLEYNEKGELIQEDYYKNNIKIDISQKIKDLKI